MAGGQGQGGGGGQLSPEVQQMLQQVMAQVYSLLRHHLPTADPGQLEEVAKAVAAEVPQMQTLFAPAPQPNTVWGVTIEKPSILQPGEHEELVTITGPRRLEEADRYEDPVNKLVSSATVYALTSSPFARALFYAHGYRLRFRVGREEPVQGAEAGADEAAQGEGEGGKVVGSISPTSGAKRIDNPDGEGDAG